ncbi:MAG: glycosyltransferase, partial [Anaerolineae bacterium]|nr:glycosyltransferase [Phycisphaerae bacterium]
RIRPEQHAAWNNLGTTLGELHRIENAIDAFRRAVELKPDYATGWRNLARMSQRGGRVDESIAASQRQLALQPNDPHAIWNIELCRRELAAERGPVPVHADRPPMWFSISVTCYGDFPGYSVRCVDSIANTPGLLDRCDVHVGCNTVVPRTLAPLRAHFDGGRLTTLVESNRNLNKSPIVRTNLGITRTPYVLVVDDDSHMLPGWLDAMDRFIERNHPFDVAGSIFEIDRDAEFQKMVEPKPWWRGIDAGHPAYRTKVFLATGGMYLARAAFLRQYNYPDRSMIIWREDAMLSDLTNQVGGKLLRFPKYVMDTVRINDGRRRGEDIMTVVPATDEDFSTPM